MPLSPNNPFKDIVEQPAPAYGYLDSIHEDKKKSGLIRAVGQTILKPVRNLAQDLGFAVSKDIREGVEAIDQLKIENPELAKVIIDDEDDFFTAPIREKPTFKRVAGDVAGTALLATPVFELNALKGLPALSTLARGAGYGAGFGASDALSDNEKLSKVLESAYVGAIIGAPLEFGAGILMKGASVAVKAGIRKTVSKVTEKYPNWIVSLEANLRKNFGKTGIKVADSFLTIDRNTRYRFGQRTLEMVEAGLIEKPRFFPWQKKSKVISKEEAWRGKDSLLDQMTGRSAPKEGLLFKLADNIRKEVKAGAEALGIRAKWLDPETYFPHFVPDAPQVKLSNKAQKALKSATSPEQKELILLGKEDSLRRDVIENAVLKDKAFKSITTAAGVLDDWIKFVESGGRITGGNKWLEWMVVSGQAKSINEAAGKTIRELRFRKRFLTERTSSLDKVREVDFPFYDPDPRRVLPLYSFESIGRLETAKMFGPKDEKLKELIGTVNAEKGFDKAQDLDGVIRQITGQIQRKPKAEQVSSFVRSLNVFKLSFAQIVNIGQSFLNPLLVGDLKSTAYGLTMAFKDEGIMSAIRSGALVGSVMKQNLAYAGGGRAFADKWLRWTGFQWTEMFNRTASSNAGQRYVQGVFNRLKKNPNNANLKWYLDEFMIDIDSALKRGGLSKEEMLRAGDIMAEKTQFLSRNIDLPGFASTPEGKVLFQFKHFAFQQAKLIKNTLKKDLQTGNYLGIARTMMLLGVVFPMTGEILADIRSLVTQEKRPTKFLDRYLANMASSGAWGIWLDFLNSLEYRSLADSAIGPTVSSVFRLMEEGWHSTSDLEIKPAFIKTLLRQTGVGRVPVNIFFPSQRDRDKGSFLEFYEEL